MEWSGQGVLKRGICDSNTIDQGTFSSFTIPCDNIALRSALDESSF